MPRFYVEGQELEVGDPRFYLPLNNATTIKDDLEKYIEDNDIEELDHNY